MYAFQCSSLYWRRNLFEKRNFDTLYYIVHFTITNVVTVAVTVRCTPTFVLLIVGVVDICLTETAWRTGMSNCIHVQLATFGRLNTWWTILLFFYIILHCIHYFFPKKKNRGGKDLRSHSIAVYHHSTACFVYSSEKSSSRNEKKKYAYS